MIMPVDIKLTFEYKGNVYKIIMSDIDTRYKYKSKKALSYSQKKLFYIRNIMFKL